MTYHQPICKPIAEHIRHIAQCVEWDEEKVILILSRTTRIVTIIYERELSERRSASDIQCVKTEDERCIDHERRFSRSAAVSAVPKKVHGDAVQHEE